MPGPSAAFQGQAIAHLGDQRVVCKAGTISADGMELVSPRAARLGQFVRMTFQLEEGGAWLDVDALLVGQEEAASEFSWRLQFQAVPPHLATLIARFIDPSADPARDAGARPARPAPPSQGGTQPLPPRRIPTGPHFPAIGSPARSGGTQPSLRRVPTGPQLASPARTGQTDPLPPLRRVPTGPHQPVASVPTGSPFRFTAAPAARSGGGQVPPNRTPPRQFPATASPAVLSSGRRAKPRQEADEEGLSDLYAEAVEHEAKREEDEKQKK